MDYCISAFHKLNYEKAWQNYIADGLFALVNQTVSYSCRFDELIHPVSSEEAKKQKKENKEQAKSIQNKLKNKLKG